MSDDPPPPSHQRRFHELYAALPPLLSRDYLAHLRAAGAADLPPQVLVRAYRELRASPQPDAQQAADETLERLLGRDDEYHYLSAVWRLARKHRWQYDHVMSVEDLVQETAMRMVIALDSPKGEFAAQAWVEFSQQVFWDTVDQRFGRHFKRVQRVRPQEPALEAGGCWSDPTAHIDAVDAGPYHGRVSSPVPWLEEFLARRIPEIFPDPVERYLAEDFFDPSPVSGARHRDGKPPLTEQLRQRFPDVELGRDAVNRKLKKVRTRLKAELMSQREYVHDDLEWPGDLGPASTRA